MKKLLALVLALMLVLSVAPVFAEEDLTTLTVLGYNQGSARMGYFKDSAAYQWIMDKTRALGIDLVIEFYVEQLIYTLSSDGKRECKGHSGMGIKSFGVPKGCLCADERTFHGAAEVEMGYKLQ